MLFFAGLFTGSFITFMSMCMVYASSEASRKENENNDEK